MKKELIKNCILVGLIILVACFFTYKIYYKFHGERSVDYSSKSLDIVFHETAGDKIVLDKATPLTDNLGLSSKGYNFSITNNLTEEVPITIKLVDDEIINNTKCGQTKCVVETIPKKNIKVSIKESGGSNQIFVLDELENDVLLDTKIDALETSTYTVRIWVKDDADSLDTDAKYYGKIQVVEDNNILARR